MMASAQIRTMEVISGCQKEFNVFEWEYKAVPAWPFLRMKIGHQLEQKKLASGTDLLSGLAPRLRRIARAAGVIGRPLSPDASSAVIFNDGSGYYRHSNGPIINKNFADIEQAMASLGISNISKYNYAQPITPAKDAIFLEPYLDRQVIKQSLMKIESHTPDTKLNHCIEYKRFLNYVSGFGINTTAINIKQLTTYIEKWMYVRNAMIDFFQYLEKGSLCLTATYYGFYGMAFVSAMKKLGHVTADVQHGLQGASHYAYGDWPRGSNHSLEQLPHLYLLWTQSDVDNINTWALGQPAYMIGPPVTHARSESLRSTVKVRRNIGDTIFLYSCSPLSTEKNIGLLKKLADLQLQFSYFLIRAHPTELKKLDSIRAYLESINLKAYDLVESSVCGLSEMMEVADANISICSSTAIECSHFGLPSLLVYEYSKDVLDIYDIGLFRYIRENEDLEGAVRNIPSLRKGKKDRCSFMRHELVSQAVKGMMKFRDDLGNVEQSHKNVL